MVVPATVVDSNTMTCRTPKLATNDYEIHVSLNGKTFHQVMIATAKVWAQTQGPAGVKASNLSKQGGYLSRKKRVADVVGDAADGAPLVRSRAGCVGPLLSSYSPHSRAPPRFPPLPSSTPTHSRREPAAGCPRANPSPPTTAARGSLTHGQGLAVPRACDATAAAGARPRGTV